MIKIIKIEACVFCHNHDEVCGVDYCWHDDIIKITDGIEQPRKIMRSTKNGIKNLWIPKWCPLEDFNEDK